MTWNRGWVELAHRHEIAPGALPASGWPVGPTAQVLSIDPDAGDFTAVVRLPVGYRRPAGHYAVETELFVLGGALRVGERIRGYGYYEHAPAGTTQEPWTAEAETAVLLMATGGRPDFLPEPGPAQEPRIELDTETMPWVAWEIVGPPPGAVGKTLRHVEATGGGTALFAMVPDYDYPKLEWHDCIEEIYCLSGDIWLGNAGTMRPGSYLWRPPYITHGPFRSEEGCIILVWTDSTLVNHFADDFAVPPEENRRAAVGA